MAAPSSGTQVPSTFSIANRSLEKLTRRLLLVVHYPVFPAAGGGPVRIVNLARGLAQCGHQVTLLTPYHPAQQEFLRRGEPFQLHQAPYFFPAHTLTQGRLLPYHVMASFHPGLKWLISQHLRNADAVLFEHASFAGLLGSVPAHIPVVYDAHNVELDYVRQECRSPWATHVSTRRIGNLENALVTRSRHVFTVSKRDGQRLSDLYGLPQQKWSVASNGISGMHLKQVSDLHQAVHERHPALAGYTRRAIFSGSNVEHNRLAVKFLLDLVAPHARDIGFIIQGGCAQSSSGRTGLKNVFFDSDHRTFHQYATPGTIGLNPVLTGSGTNLKLLYYLSHGLPVLSTPFGVRGYEDLGPFVRTTDPAAFPQALREGNFPASPDPAYLMEHYGWDNIAARMAEVLERVICSGA